MPPVRATPAASCLLYTPGSEGYAIEQGFDIYDVPAHRLPRERDYRSGLQAWSYTPSIRAVPGRPGKWEPSVEAIPEIGVVCPRPRLVMAGVILSQFAFYGGSWETLARAHPPRVTQLIQYKTAADAVWRAETVANLVANPSIAFLIHRMESHHNHTETSLPSYAEIVVGGEWSIRFSASQTAGIWRYIDGQWRQVAPIRIDAREPTMVWFCVRRGAVCISLDQGESWNIVRGETAISVPAAKVVLEGVGGQVAFSAHQLAFDDCSYTTYPHPVMEEHMGPLHLELTAVSRPLGTSIRIVEVASPPASVAYRVEMTSAIEASGAFGFNNYKVPEVYATRCYYQTALQSVTPTSVDLASTGQLVGIELHEDADITNGARSGSISIHVDAGDTFSGVYGFRMVGISFGHRMDDGTYQLTSRATMYMMHPEPTASDDWRAGATFDLADLWIRATSMIVDEGWRPLDGLTTSAARDYILRKMGLDTARRSWLATGVVLPAGPADDPRWWPEPGMTAADLFAALDVMENTETYVNANAIWTNRVARYTDAAVGWTYDGEAVNPDVAVRGIRYRAEHRDVKTATLVHARDSRGGALWATSINYGLERAPATSGFVGWRRWNRLDGAAVTSLAQAMAIAGYQQALIDDVPLVAEFDTPADPGITRGSRIQIVNCEQVGITGTEHFRVEEITHRWTPVNTDTVQTIRARRIW